MLKDNEEVEAQLLDGLIPAAFRSSKLWTAQQAGRWLSYVAKQPDASGFGVLRVDAVHASGAVLLVGLLAPLLLAGFVLGVAFYISAGWMSGFVAALTAAGTTVVGLLVLSVCGLAYEEMDKRRRVLHTTRPQSPRGEYFQARRSFVVVSTSVLVILGLLTFLDHSSAILLTIEWTLGIFISWYASPWPWNACVHSWLALRRSLPWRLAKFFDYAHHNGVLRQDGANYQFRHVEFQRHLRSRTVA